MMTCGFKIDKDKKGTYRQKIVNDSPEMAF